MAQENIIESMKQAVGTHTDFPKKGILFRDFLPILRSPTLFDGMLTHFQNYIKQNAPDSCIVVGLESRGFLFGPSLALKMGLPFVPVRKPGKLPGNVSKVTYDLEYGTDTLEIQNNAVSSGQKVIIVDDLIATGGSMEAAVKLVNQIGGQVELCLSVLELCELKGRNKISAPVYSILQY